MMASSDTGQELILIKPRGGESVMTLVGIVSPFLLSRQLYLVISCYSVSNNYFLYIEHSRTRNKEINTCLRLNSNYLLIISVNTFQMAT